MPSSEQPPFFLATTAIEDFWDTSLPLIFLGDWCRRYSRRTFWEPLGGKVLASPWQEREESVAAYHYVNRTYESILPILGAALNRLRGVNHSERYWRIVLGPWLLYFLPVVYDRLRHVTAALEQYPGITTIGLAPESFVTPKDTIDFVFLASDDPYNLQLTSQILMFLGQGYTQKSLKIVSIPTLRQASTSFKSRLKDLIRNFLEFVQSKRQDQHPIIFKHCYFSRQTELRLIFSTLGLVWPNSSAVVEVASYSLDNSARSTIQESLPECDQFHALLKFLIPTAFPVSFLEAYKTVAAQCLALYPSEPKAIFSANACYYDEAFKQWIATRAEKGTLLMGTQHGGNYGSIAMMPSEDHETAIADRYYSWGWERSDCHATVTPMPASKLVGKKRIGFNPNAEGCLFVATSMQRYLIQFPFQPVDFVDYLQWQVRFVDALAPEIRQQMRVRLHYADYGWDMLEQWRQRYPAINLESWDIPFQKSLEDSRLYVCDHLSTTFIEALAADKPTILFWDPLVNELRGEAKPYYDGLRKAGILHDTPEQAAAMVSSCFVDVGKWWNSTDCQAARRQFCGRFARTSPHPVRDWAREFRMINGKALNSSGK